MKHLVSGALLTFALPLLAGTAAAANTPTITLYAQPKYSGPSLQLVLPATDLHALGFADRAMSFIVQSGTWQLCDHPNFGGHCITAGPGKYPAGYANSFGLKVVSAQPLAAPAHG